ncbi:MAG: DUF11 domain-containing protein, partial [Woeseiaceae bacterium]|nr:DUF11 domain-containing protein [Woeseiaceae bacterium]
MKESIARRFRHIRPALVVVVLALPAGAPAAPDLEIQKTVDNPTPIPNESVEFTVRVSNVGDEAAIDVHVLDPLPAGLIIPPGMAAFPGTGSYDPASGDWTVGDLDPADSAVLTLPAMLDTANPPQCIVNTASAALSADANVANNAARAAIRQPGTERCVDLDVDFGISVGPVSIFPDCDLRDRYRGHVDVTNHGPDSARNVAVSISQDPVIGPNLRFDDDDCSNAPAARCNIVEI